MPPWRRPDWTSATSWPTWIGKQRWVPARNRRLQRPRVRSCAVTARCHETSTGGGRSRSPGWPCWPRRDTADGTGRRASVPSSTEPQGSPATSGTAVVNWLADAGWPCTDGGVSLGRHADRPVTRWRTSHGNLVVKVFSGTDAAVRTYLAMTSLWHSPFGAARRPPGLPEPLLLLPGNTAVATRQVVGDVLPDGAEALCPFLPGVAELLADLHGSGCPLPRRRGRGALLPATRRQAADPRGAPAEAAWRGGGPVGGRGGRRPRRRGGLRPPPRG